MRVLPLPDRGLPEGEEGWGWGEAQQRRHEAPASKCVQNGCRSTWHRLQVGTLWGQGDPRSTLGAPHPQGLSRGQNGTSFPGVCILG